MKLAVKWGKLRPDAAVAINEIPEGNGRERVLSAKKEEQQYLRHASTNLRDAAIVSVDSGVRPEELFTLLWENVDLASRAETPNGVIHIREGKTDAAKRSIPLTPRAADVLKRRKMEAEAGAEALAVHVPRRRQLWASRFSPAPARGRNPEGET